MEIRKMTMDDYEQVYNLWLSTEGVGLNNLDDSRQGIEKFLQRNPETCFVAATGGVLKGVIMSGHDGRRGFIYHTAVCKDERSQGTGTALVKAALAALEKEGVSKVALVVFDNNTGGNAFWEKQGFHRRTDLAYRNKSIKEMQYLR